MRKIVQNSLFYDSFSMIFSQTSKKKKKKEIHARSCVYAYTHFILNKTFFCCCCFCCCCRCLLSKTKESCCNKLLPGLNHFFEKREKLLTFMIVFVSRHLCCVRYAVCASLFFPENSKQVQVCRIDAVNVIINIFMEKGRECKQK